jgi:frataxin-like iron-binding protein CyaY
MGQILTLPIENVGLVAINVQQPLMDGTVH